jgi:glycosyltransferase involved in cell wall biosynthesis
MDIIVLEQYPSSRRGGQGIVLFEVCRVLAKRGHNISLLYTQEDNLLEQYQQFCSQVIKVSKFIISRPQDISNFFVDIAKIRKEIATTENSVILCNEIPNIPFGWILTASKNIPLIGYLHYTPDLPLWTLWSNNKGLQGFKSLLVGFLHKLQSNIAIKQVNRFIAVSQQTKSNWVNSSNYDLENIIDVVYNGIDLEAYKPTTDFSTIRKEWQIPENIKIISYVGRLDKEKGLETLIKAFALLLNNEIGCQLIIAGKPVSQDEDYQKSLERLSSDLGIENYVKFIGHVSNPCSIYQMSDITVLPSRWAEPFGRVIIESMACGTPVVASRIGGIPEILTGGFEKLLFEPENELELSKILSKVIHWRDKEPELSHKCIHHIFSKFSLGKTVDGIEKVLESQIIAKIANSNIEDKYGTT